MGPDISRARFDALRDYAGVGLQQGRLLLDSEFNELVDIIDRRLRASAADLATTGPTPGIQGVAVVPRTTPHGFEVTAAGGELSIGPGRMYVDGLLAENHLAGDAQYDAMLAEPTHGDACDYSAQPYWPTPDALPAAGTYLAYLDVWDRVLTSLQQPDLTEIAVGVETTTRTQTVWQVRLLDPTGGGVGGGVSCSTPDADIAGWNAIIAPSAGRLTTSTVPVDPSLDPCVLPPTGDYRGLENQLYRVEVHTGGPLGTATFKWSRDDASVTSSVTEIVSLTTIRVDSIGRDAVLRIANNDWVEITDDNRELNQQPGELRKVTVDDSTRTLTFSPALPADLIPNAPDTVGTRHTRVVRWDQSGKVNRADGTTLVDLDAAGASGEIPAPADGSQIVLESGVTVSFSDAPVGGSLRSGDFWQFAGRTADTSLEPLNQAPPRGVAHHYARLGFVTFPDGQTDCRTQWPPASGTSTDCDCTVCVTPESHASGVLTIQDAVKRVRQTGGTICLAQGQYRLDRPVEIISAQSVHIHGQGLRTLVISEGAAFNLINSVDCSLRDLGVVTTGEQPAIGAGATALTTLERLVVFAFPTHVVAGQPVDDKIAAPADETDPGDPWTGVGIALAGITGAMSIRDNLIVAQTCIQGGVQRGNDVAGKTLNTAMLTHASSTNDDRPGAGMQAVLTADLRICDNVLLGSDAGVYFDERSVHVLGCWIRDNLVLGGRDTGILDLGLPAVGTVVDIAGNDCLIAGTGITVGGSSFTVRNNSIMGPPAFNRIVATMTLGAAKPASGDPVPADGIKVQRASVPIISSGVNITGNAVQRKTGVGIVALTTVPVRVRDNTVFESGVGVWGMTFGAALEVRANHLKQLDAGGDGPLWGIVALGAGSTQIIDNVVEDFTGDPTSATIGIVAAVCGDVRISGNHVHNLVGGVGQPKLGQIASAVGISTHGTLGRIQVDHNQVRNDPPTDDKTRLVFTALQIGDPPKAASVQTLPAPVASPSILATHLVRLNTDQPKTLLLNSGVFHLIEHAAPQVIVDANLLDGDGACSVWINVPDGDVVTSANIIEHSWNSDFPGLTINASRAVVQGNRISGEAGRIILTCPSNAESYTMLGNLTDQGIVVNGQPLPAPWQPLNVPS